MAEVERKKRNSNRRTVDGGVDPLMALHLPMASYSIKKERRGHALLSPIGKQYGNRKMLVLEKGFLGHLVMRSFSAHCLLRWPVLFISQPYAYWKGNPHVSRRRADLMKCNLTSQNDWNARLYAQDWIAESKSGYKQSNLGDQCTHRYKIYIEGRAWSVSYKYILACNSPALLMTLNWYDFFSRGLIPQRHYWPVRDKDKCKSLKFAVEWGNNHTEKEVGSNHARSKVLVAKMVAQDYALQAHKDDADSHIKTRVRYTEWLTWAFKTN